MIRYVIVIMFLISVQKVIVAQPLQFKRLPDVYEISNLGIRTLLQDSKGFIWLGTWHGLYRYDGYNMRHFEIKTADNKTTGFKIVALAEDALGNIWIGTQNTGVHKLDRETETFTSYQHDNFNAESIVSNRIEAIFQDSKKRIWFGTEHGLELFHNETFLHINYPPLNTANVYCISEMRDKRLLVGTTWGFFIGKETSRGNWEFQHQLFEDKSLPELNNFIYDVKEDPIQEGILWCGTKNGLKCYNLNTKKITAFNAKPNGLANDFVHHILFTRHDEPQNTIWLWAATDNGLCRMNLNTQTFSSFYFDEKDENSLTDNLVQYLLQDRSGLIWMGTNKGLNMLNLHKKPFENINWESQTNVTCFTATPTNLWVGSFGQGLAQISFKNNKFSIERYSFGFWGNYTYGIHVDTEGWLWLATRGGGIFKTHINNVRNYKQYSISNAGLSDDYIMSLFEDSEHIMWFGTWNSGIIKYDRKTNSFTPIKKLTDNSFRFEDYPVVQFFEPPMQNNERLLWVGTRGGGLLELALDKMGNIAKTNKIYTDSNKNQNTISNNFINCFYKDKQGRVWVGTERGLNLWNHQTRSFTELSKDNNLQNHNIQSIQEDSSGMFWITTLQGLIKTALNDKGIFNSRYYDKKDGLPSNFYNAASGIQWQNRLFFGSNNGILHFNPFTIQDNPIPPSVSLVNFELFNKAIQVNETYKNRIILSKSIAETPIITLNYDDNVFSIEYAALHFDEPDKNQFAYRLIGFNEQWIYTNKRTAHYTNLPEGTYTFEVKASNNDGIWSQDIARATIVVKPPFWRTWWAYVIYVLGILVAIYAYRRIIIAREKLRNQIKLETFKREQMEEVSQMKVHFFTNVSHELRTPLTLILTPLEDLLQRTDIPPSIHDIIKLMHYNATRLYTLISQILDFRKSEEGLMSMQIVETDLVKFLKNITIAFRDLAAHRHIHFVFKPSIDTLKVWIDRDLMEKVYYNLISNAFKYSDDGCTITISIKKDDTLQMAVVSFEDTGMGIAIEDLPYIFKQFYRAKNNFEGMPRTGTGIGLALSKSITELHKGTIEVESALHKGSTFTVTIPLGYDHFDEKIINFNYKDTEDSSHYQVPTTAPQYQIAIEEEENIDHPLILVVEDNADIRAYIHSNLDKEFTVKEAENGRIAWELAQNLLPNLIISDIIMPEMDGLELCKNIKTDERTSHIPVILLTARSSQIYEIEGFETGTDAYLTKPFNTKLLLTRVRTMLKNNERIQKHYAKNFQNIPNTESQNLSTGMRKLDRQFLERCIMLVERHIDNSDYSIDQMGQALSISRMQLYRKLKALTGETPTQFIRTIRLKRAAQLISEGFSIQEATYKVGFQDLKYFRECFKKQFGVNPKEYS